MARYKLSIECEIDECYPLSDHTDVVRALIINCCPSAFGMCENCDLLNCRACWLKALSEGVRADAAENVHVERVD